MKRDHMTTLAEAASKDRSKQERIAQNKVMERDLHDIFRGIERDPADKANEGIAAIGEKIQRDLEHQLQEVVAARETAASDHANREVARILRMLEKRKDVLEQLANSIAIDEALFDAAHWLIAGASDAQN